MLIHPLQANDTIRRGYLYKYKSLRGQNYGHVVEIIKDCRIYCPRPSELNDPEECKPQLVINDIADPAYRPKVDDWVRRCVARRHPAPSEPEIQAELKSQTQAKLESLVREATLAYHEEIEAQYRILSFADSPENHHLWANYADHYSGICMQFFVNPMLGSAFQMDYLDTLSAIDIADNEGFGALVATALVKRTKWRAEGEYRLIFRIPPLPGDPPLIGQKFCFPRQLLTGIILGYRVAENIRSSLLRVIRDHAPHVWCAEATGGPPFSTMQILGDR